MGFSIVVIRIIPGGVDPATLADNLIVKVGDFVAAENVIVALSAVAVVNSHECPP
jgi:hypothetical protein